MSKRNGRKKRSVDKTIYIILIIGLVVFGLWETDAAVKLIHAVIEAFKIIFSSYGLN